MASIKIATGLKTYDIEDEKGNIRGQISFNPSDINFFERADATRAKIAELLENVEKVKDEVTEESDVIKYITDTDNSIKNEINKLFDDENASTVVFGKQNCLNTLNGVTFVERFLEAFTPIIQEAFVEEQKKMQTRVDKYTSQVRK